MAVEYDEQFFREIPEETLGEVRSLKDDPRFEGIPDVSRTMVWKYSNDRRRYDGISFAEFKNLITSSYNSSIDNAFRIPPINNAPFSNRVFSPGFGMTTDNMDDLIRDLLREEGFSRDPSKLTLSKVGRLPFLWTTFFDSQGEDFLGDPTITLPRVIVYGETMKGHDGHGSSHFEIEGLMKRIGEKYNIPTYSMSASASV